MSGYVKSVKHEIDFDGDKVTVAMRPILFSDVIRLRSVAKSTEVDIVDDDGTKVKGIDLGDEYRALAAQLLPSYVEELRGLTDAAGTPITVEEVCRAAYFAPIVFSCINRLVKESRPVNPQRPANGSTAISPAQTPASATPSAPSAG